MPDVLLLKAEGKGPAKQVCGENDKLNMKALVCFECVISKICLWWNIFGIICFYTSHIKDELIQIGSIVWHNIKWHPIKPLNTIDSSSNDSFK